MSKLEDIMKVFGRPCPACGSPDMGEHVVRQNLFGGAWFFACPKKKRTRPTPQRSTTETNE